MKRLRLGLALLVAACGASDDSAGANAAGAGGAAGGGAAGAALAGAGGQEDGAGGKAGGAGTGGAGAGDLGAAGEAGAAGTSSSGGAVACGQCFPVEELPEALRAKAEATLLKALDSEALFTIVGGLKPMSSGFVSLDFPADGSETDAVKEARQLLGALRCSGALTANLQVFASVFDGKKAADGVFFRRPRFDKVVSQRPVFAEIGLTDGASPLQVVEAVDKYPTTKRFRAYGYLFGYPDHAVDFFVNAAEEEEKTGKFVERDFFAIPTFSLLTGGYTYAVPKGYAPATVDLELQAKAADILASYQQRRAQFIGEGKPGPVALLRAWFDDGGGQCSPDHAAVKANAGTYQFAPSCWGGLKSCNPLTNEGCDGAGGWACDLSEDGFQCFEPPNESKKGESCNNSKGPFCEGGAHCDGSTCAAFCCADADCQGDEVCEPLSDQGSVGICRKPGACSPAGGACSKDADCCSNDCHGDHCH